MKKCLLFFFVAGICVQLTAQSFEEKMDQVMNAFVSQKKFNGSVLVAQKGRVMYEHGFGYRNAEQTAFSRSVP